MALPMSSTEDYEVLRFPARLAQNWSLFDRVIYEMLQMSESQQDPSALRGWLSTISQLEAADVKMLVESYSLFGRLQREGRNHIWGYFTRNWSRPVWLAAEAQKADVVIGNPPWLRYSRMSHEMQQSFREKAQQARLWVGGRFATANDLASYFFVRAASLYMKQQGKIMMVMPYAAMVCQPYAMFLNGQFSLSRTRTSTLRISNAWMFDHNVKPLFPVPSCVLQAEPAVAPGPLPDRVRAFQGVLPRRDARPEEADRTLSEQTASWPAAYAGGAGSPYRRRFRQGATLVPRRLVLVEEVPGGRLGTSHALPVVRGRVGAQDKAPWKSIMPPQGPVEREFLRRIYLGESIAPFRTLDPVLGVIPCPRDRVAVLDSVAATNAGYLHLSRWLSNIERIWAANAKSRHSFSAQLNYYQKLTAQFPTAPIRVAFSKAGTIPCAAVVLEEEIILDHKLYWLALDSIEEGIYISAVLNSTVVAEKTRGFQSQGQFGPRDIDKTILGLPIPAFVERSRLHQDIVLAGRRARAVASSVPLDCGMHFQNARRRIRSALNADGVSEEIDELVDQLLTGA